jgi:hypothetical protein
MESSNPKMPPMIRKLSAGPTSIIKVGQAFSLEWYFENSGWYGHVSLAEYQMAVAELNGGRTKFSAGENVALPWLLPVGKR